MTTHVGTHIDSLGHFSIGDHLYGVIQLKKVLVIGDYQLGVENIPPIITRGLCLNLSRLDDADCLEAGRPITSDDLKRAYDDHNITPQKGMSSSLTQVGASILCTTILNTFRENPV